MSLDKKTNTLTLESGINIVSFYNSPDDTDEVELIKYINDNDIINFSKKLYTIKKHNFFMISGTLKYHICQKDRVNFLKLLVDLGYFTSLDTVFYDAISTESKNILEYLISEDCSPPLSESRVIEHCINCGSVTMLKFFVNRGWVVSSECIVLASVKNGNNNKETYEMVKFLLEYGFDVNSEYIYETEYKDQKKQFITTVLHPAIESINLPLVKLILNYDPVIFDTHLAYATVDNEVFQLIHNQRRLTESELDVVLYEAVFRGSFSVLQFLLDEYDYPSNLIKKYYEKSKSSLDLDISRLRVTTEKINLLKNTLEKTCPNDSIILIDELIVYIDKDDIQSFSKKIVNIDRNLIQNDIDTLLKHICRLDKPKFLQSLLNLGYELSKDKTELFYRMVMMNCINMVEYFISENMSPPLKDEEVIDFCANYGTVDMLKKFINYGWVVSSKCLVYTLLNKNKENIYGMVKLLLEYGLDVNSEYTRYEEIKSGGFGIIPVTYNILKMAIHSIDLQLIKLILNYDPIITVAHLSSAVRNTEIFHLIHNQRTWNEIELEGVFRTAVSDGTDSVFKFLLEKYDLSQKIIKEYYEMSQANSLTFHLIEKKISPEKIALLKKLAIVDDLDESKSLIDNEESTQPFNNLDLDTFDF